MSVVTLSEVLKPALHEGYALAGLVVLGWEDAVCYIEAGKAAGLPVILQAGPGCRRHTPLPVLGKMFRHLAELADIDVVCHLDHGNTLDEIREAIDCGFSYKMEPRVKHHSSICALVSCVCFSCMYMYDKELIQSNFARFFSYYASILLVAFVFLLFQ